MSDRQAARDAFVRAAGFQNQLLALPSDASFRSYHRLLGSDPPLLLMDAPPPKEGIQPFARIAEHLLDIGLCVPELYQRDEGQGFLLLEDFGDATFTRLLEKGEEEAARADYERCAQEILKAIEARAQTWA